MNTSYNFHNELKKLEHLYMGLPNAVLGVFLLSSIILFGFYDNVDHQNLITWYILNLFILLLRAFSLIYYKKTLIDENNFSLFYWIFLILSTITASIWGSIAFFLFPETIVHQTVLLIFVSALVSSAAVSLSAKVEVFYIYLVLAITPFIYVFTFDGIDSHKLLASALFIYIFVIASFAKKIANTIKQNIQIAHQNEHLIGELEKKVIEADSSNKAKSDFLSVMSHEIRTPLNAILGFVSILKRSEKDKVRYKYLDTIDKSSKILTNVINDILDLSKIESGKFTLEMSIFNPQEEFQSLFLLYEQTALEKEINLINSISKDLPPQVSSDILRIKQILSNLLSNALKFTESRKNIELIIDFNEQDSTLLFKVIDEGIGISDENIHKITQSFVQADSSTARQYGGTGLGLSIATNLLDLFHSKLEITSELGKGSCFQFEVQIQTLSSTQEENTFILKNASFENKTILVAEDNKTNQMLIELLLSEFGINVKIANDGLEAENIFKEESFDMVLMDIDMPNKNGLEAMKDINEFQSIREIQTPIVALTANAVSGDRERFIKEGFDEYLAKPIDDEALQKVLHKFLD